MSQAHDDWEEHTAWHLPEHGLGKEVAWQNNKCTCSIAAVKPFHAHTASQDQCHCASCAISAAAHITPAPTHLQVVVLRLHVRQVDKLRLCNALVRLAEHALLEEQLAGGALLGVLAVLELRQHVGHVLVVVQQQMLIEGRILQGQKW